MRTETRAGGTRIALLVILLGALSCATPPPPTPPARAEPPAATAFAPRAPAPEAHLASWNDGQSKRRIVDFVARVTREGGPDFVPPAERIATFDNDGTLWAEQPIYFQVAFALDRVRDLAPGHPEWKTEPPFSHILSGDPADLKKVALTDIPALLEATHSGVTIEAFREIAHEWLSTALHPRFHRPYREIVYQPMVELLEYLRANGFRTYIVSGGGVEFMRSYAEWAYGIPPEQIIGSSLETRFELQEGRGVLMRQPELDSFDDQGQKPVNIGLHIGRRPILAFGNSDGDLQMLQYTTTGGRPSLGLILHHDDALREWAYDRASPIGRLDRALDEATVRGWTVVSIENDFRRVFAFETP